MSKTIALFGGAFDPVHIDHATIGSKVLELGLADEVWYVPSPDRWDKRLFASAEHRLAMLRLALAHESRFVVSDLEIRMGDFRGTYQFLRTLADAAPDCEFRLVIGSDSYSTIPKWRDPLNFYGSEFNGHLLLQDFSLVVFARKGYPMPDASTHEAQGWRPFGSVGPSEGFEGVFASTAIRDSLAIQHGVVDGLHPDVMAYIGSKGLYRLGS